MNVLADDESPELTREGLLGKLAGKAKEAAGELVGNDDLAREGRRQQAQVDADAEAAHDANKTVQREGGADLARREDRT